MATASSLIFAYSPLSVSIFMRAVLITMSCSWGNVDELGVTADVPLSPAAD